MAGKLINRIKQDSGAVQIVEAAFVFPVMFLILFFLIYMGNAHFIKAQIESVVETQAIRGAAFCADPILQSIRENDRVPDLKDLEVQPYRYLFGGMNDVEDFIGEEVVKEITGQTQSAFSNMSPNLKTHKDDIAKFHNYLVYSTFSVEVKYQIELPIRFLGAETPPILTIQTRAEVPVSDTAEFIRNTDMVIDLFVDTKLGQGISQAFGKINDFITNFAKK